MKPAWDSLAEEFASSNTVLIADVDCTVQEQLCEQHGIEGFPTIKSFAAGDTEGEDYEGGRDIEDLREFAKSLGPSCSVSNKAVCSEEQLAELEKLLAMPTSELEAELEKLKASVTAAEEAHEELVQGLQQQFEDSEKKTTEIKNSAKPRMKALRAALGGGGTPSAAKDEV